MKANNECKMETAHSQNLRAPNSSITYILLGLTLKLGIHLDCQINQNHDLMMEAARTSETLVNFYQTTRCYNSEDSHLRMSSVFVSFKVLLKVQYYYYYYYYYIIILLPSAFLCTKLICYLYFMHIYCFTFCSLYVFCSDCN
jgi:hypothetical protein